MLDKEYVMNRVATANDLQLVTLLYEGLIEYLKDAAVAIQSKDKEACNQHITKVRDILAELLATLDGSSEITLQLRSIYLYINNLVTEGYNKQQALKLHEAIRVIQPIFEGFSTIADAQETEKTPPVVTGYTYGKGHLNSHVIEEKQWKKG